MAMARKQLYLVINTSPEVQGNLLPQIQEFHRRLDEMHRIHPQASGEFIPSNRANIVRIPELYYILFFLFLR